MLVSNHSNNIDSNCSNLTLWKYNYINNQLLNVYILHQPVDQNTPSCKITKITCSDIMKTL